MGFELDAFLGRASELRKWKRELPSAVVCELGGELGLVPVTGKLSAELRARLGNDADRLDRDASTRSSPSASQVEALRRWAERASAEAPLAQISTGEFGNQSHERASVWSGGEEVLSGVGVRAALDCLRDRAGLDLGNTPIGLEKYRGEDAAEKWAAAATSAQDGRAAVADAASRDAARKKPSWLFFGGAAIFFGLIFLRLSFEQSSYEHGGVRVQGVVTDKAYAPGSGAGIGARTASFSSYYVLYRFTTTDGRIVDGKDDVLPDLWRELVVGGPVAVEYLASSPDTNQVPKQRAGSRVFRVVAIVVLLAGAALGGIGLWTNRAQRERAAETPR